MDKYLKDSFNIICTYSIMIWLQKSVEIFNLIIMEIPCGCDLIFDCIYFELNPINSRSLTEYVTFLNIGISQISIAIRKWDGGVLKYHNPRTRPIRLRNTTVMELRLSCTNPWSYVFLALTHRYKTISVFVRIHYDTLSYFIQYQVVHKTSSRHL